MEGNPVRRKGNLLRTEWRNNCRHILADHLSEPAPGYTWCLTDNTGATQLGITVLPDQVRLQPRVDDGYMWIRQPEREHLFAKQLSKHSVGAYMELCREVGSSIEAVPPQELTNTTLEHAPKVR